MEIVIAVVAKIAEYTVRPVGQWLCYSCHYKSNMENLKELEKTLQDAKNRVQHDVDTASNNGDEIEDDVKTWFTKVDGIIDQLATKKLGGGEEEAESRNSNVSCLNLKQRHQISREAKEMADNIAELLRKANFPGVSYRTPTSQEMVTPRNVDYMMTLDSRILITKRIMEVLGDANISKIGVWGLPGVGKSTLMKEIFRKAKEESLFDEVAMANVTDSPNLSRIQGEIADMLGLKLDPHITGIGRKANLRKRLEKDKEKKILVILDDIWKRLDLEEIGITPSERCKVLLTSRDRQVLASEMGTEENSFELDILGQEEARNLFEKMAGDSVKDDHDLRNAAIEVAKACGGLPIALVTVSRALKNKNLGAWKDALVQLTRPTPEHDTKIWLPVYTCIQLSYKHLDGSELQSLFLLCARQGYYISYRELLRYGFGLSLFHGIDTLEEARNRLENLVRDLQDACLLLQSPRSPEEFYMHDVVCHVATIIASNDHNMFVMRGDGGQKAWPDVDALTRCEALSIHGADHIQKYPTKKECPKLRYFHVQCNIYPIYKTPSSTSFQGMDKLEDIFFQGMEKLEVLSLTNIQLSSLLPPTNLQTLCLDRCNLGDIHWIGELKTSVILSLARSDISNLPGEIGSLTGLRLLDLTDCFELTVIPPNVLSSLVNLEELYMRNIDVQWEVEGPNNEGKSASLAELKHLSHLITLEIDIIEDANNLPKDLFSKKLERYKICIGGNIWDPFFTLFKEAAFSRTLKLKLNMSLDDQLDFGIKMLLKRTKYLYLDESNSTKSVLHELDREDFQHLKHLHIQNNCNIMHLHELRTSFKNLKVLKAENCEKLRFIFSSSITRGLSLLEELNITRCNNVGAIFVKEEEDEIEEVFRRLQTLVLRDLPKLVSFLSTRETNWEGNYDLQLPLLHHQLSFPNLKELYLEGLPRIKHVWSKEIFRFQDLLHFRVARCENLKSLFPTASMATSLTQLKSLKIIDCGVMEEIVEREDGTDPTMWLLFSSLTLLRLDGLSKLKWFSQGVCTLESSSSKELHEQQGTLFRVEEVAFPNLTKLHLCGLAKIKHVWSKDPQTILKFQNLQEITAQKCASLKSLFPASIAGCLKQLNNISIYDCGVEEIVRSEGGEAVGRTLVFVFPQVTYFYLANLQRLECFYKGMHISKWPMLKYMMICECKKVEVFASKLVSEETVEEKQSQMSIKQPLFLVDETSFPSLELLEIYKLEKLEIIWDIKDSYQCHMYNFPNLLYIDVYKCKSLKSLFPAALVATSLPQLKSLKIEDCVVMEEIVARENANPTKRLLFPSLNFLSLDGLPKLKWFFQGVHTLESSSSKELLEQRGTLFGHEEVALPNLTNLYLRGLSKIKHVWSKDPQTILRFQNLQEITAKECAGLKSLFPASVGGCLKQLKTITIYDSGVEEIVGAEGEGEVVGRTLVFVFPQVTALYLKNLPRLECFYKGVHVSKWPMLKKMLIEGCEKVEIFASGLVSEEIVEERQSQMSIKQPLFLDKTSCPSLEI